MDTEKIEILGILTDFCDELNQGKLPDIEDTVSKLFSLIVQKAPVAEVPCSVGLGADADYAYKDVAEFEEIVKYKVNEAFRTGWSMARTTNKQLRALAGEEEGP